MARTRAHVNRLHELPTFDRDSGCINAVVETPKGSRAKLGYDPDLNAMVLKHILPEGMSFPFDFGFIPSTLEDDGDPMDVLVLMDAAIPAPCVVPSRLVGVIEARQTERNGETVDNARLVAIGERCQLFADIKRLSDLPSSVVQQIQTFFISYNQQNGKTFEVVACRGPQKAKRLVEEGQRRRRARRK